MHGGPPDSDAGRDVSATARRETSGVTTALIVRYVQTRGGDEAVAAVLRAAGDSRSAEELADESRWSTYAQKVALFEAAAEVLGDPVVARHVGETVVEQRVGHGVRLLLRATGSPAGVLRNIARTAPKFSTVCTMTTSEIEPSRAVVDYRLHEEHVPSSHDCAYNVGLLSQVSVLFGLPAARIEHPECQVRGAASCVYVVRWRPRDRWWRGRNLMRIELLEDQLDAVTRRAESLQLTVSDLVGSDDVATVLQRIVARAASTVSAGAHLLAVRGPDGEPQVHAEGMSAPDAHRVALEVLLGHWPTDGSMLVVDVATSARTFGQLVALGGAHQQFFAEEKRLLAAYARHAAVALEVALALSEARDASRDRQRSEQRYRSLYERNSDAVFCIDREGAFTEVNPAAERLSGYSTRELVGSPFAPLVAEEDVARGARVFADALAGRGQPFDLTFRHKDGSAVAVAGASFPIVVDGEITGIFGIVRDVSDRRRREEEERRKTEELSQLAFSDALTGLPNRVLFRSRLEASLHQPLADDTVVAVMFVDLDDLKAVNDRVGHAAGDALLVAVSHRLRAALRPGDLAGRLGGDEFGVIVDGAPPGSVETLAERLRAVVAEPLRLATGEVVSTTASIGVAVAGRGDAGDVLLARADAAMYAAKSSGKDRCTVAR